MNIYFLETRILSPEIVFVLCPETTSDSDMRVLHSLKAGLNKSF